MFVENVLERNDNHVQVSLLILNVTGNFANVDVIQCSIYFIEYKEGGRIVTENEKTYMMSNDNGNENIEMLTLPSQSKEERK